MLSSIGNLWYSVLDLLFSYYTIVELFAVVLDDIDWPKVAILDELSLIRGVDCATREPIERQITI